MNGWFIATLCSGFWSVWVLLIISGGKKRCWLQTARNRDGWHENGTLRPALCNKTKIETEKPRRRRRIGKWREREKERKREKKREELYDLRPALFCLRFDLPFHWDASINRRPGATGRFIAAVTLTSHWSISQASAGIPASLRASGWMTLNVASDIKDDIKRGVTLGNPSASPTSLSVAFYRPVDLMRGVDSAPSSGAITHHLLLFVTGASWLDRRCVHIISPFYYSLRCVDYATPFNSTNSKNLWTTLLSLSLIMADTGRRRLSQTISFY